MLDTFCDIAETKKEAVIYKNVCNDFRREKYKVVPCEIIIK